MAGDHKCSVCQATFTRPQHVARHMRSHTGDRPYKCEHCGDQFARSDLLSRHVNKCHSVEAVSGASAGNANSGTGRRKALSASTRATTSKQACDQCVLSSLPCDGANPCSKCSMRKLRCSFVKFHRQTAPCGPGHLPPQPQQTDIPLPPPTSTRPLTAPERESHWGGPQPLMGTPHSLYSQPFAYQPPAQSYTNGSAQMMQGGLHVPGEHPMAPSHGLSNDGSPYQQNAQPGNSWFAWDISDQERPPSDSSQASSYHSYPLQPGYSYPSRPNSAYHSSAGSTSSSAASSSLNLPLLPPSDGQHLGFAATVDEMPYLSSRPTSSHTQAFSSAFGMLSLEHPNAENTIPFFSSENPDAMRLPPIATLADATPMPKEGQVMRDMFKSYLRTPSYETSLQDNVFTSPRRRTNSLPAQKTPGATEAGIESRGLDMAGYQAAVLARNGQEPMRLAPPPMRRGSNAAALAASNAAGTNEQHHHDFTVNALAQSVLPGSNDGGIFDYGPPKHQQPSQFAYDSPSNPQQDAQPSRPNFKRLASQTLVPPSSKRQETLPPSLTYDYNGSTAINSLSFSPNFSGFPYGDTRNNYDGRPTTSSGYVGSDGRPISRLPEHRRRSSSTAAERRAAAAMT